MKKLLTSLTLLALLSSCNLASDYEDPAKQESLEKAVADNFYHAKGIWAEVSPDKVLDKGDWWAIFGDATLDSYMKDLKEHNPDLKSAFYRVEQARTAAAMTEAELYPHLAGSASFARSDSSSNVPQTNTGLYNSWLIGTALTWDLDFFGRVRNLLASEVATAQATYAAYQNTMLILESEVATAYFTLKQYVSEEELLKETIDLRVEQLKLVEDREKAGGATLVDVERARQQLFEAKAQLAAISKAKELSKDYIALLLGTTRGNIEINESMLEASIPLAPKTVPSEILQRRPDVMQAERGVFSANELIGAATAAFFPTVAITASAELNSNRIEDLFKASSLAWGVSPSVYFPIFQAGRLYYQRKQSLYAHKEMLENYRSVVLKAINQVEDALVSIKYLDMEYNSRNEAMKASQSVANLTQKQYDLGFVDYFELSDSLRLLLVDQRSVISIKGDQYRELIKLMIASGGSLENKAKENKVEENKAE